MRGIFLRGAFWVWADEVLLRGVARGMAKRSAGTDAGEMGRDAWVWSGLVLVFGCRFRLRNWPVPE